MSFITKNNARQLEYQVDRDEIEKIFIEDLYKLSLWMLNRKEQQWLAAARMFYENPDFYVSHIYKKIERKPNTNLIYAGGTPAYHAKQDCEVLKNDYINYEIPVEIIFRGEETVHDFREWWKSEETLLNSNPERFVEIMSIRWLLQNPPKIQSISANNSGIETHVNPDIGEIESEIDLLIQSMNELRANNPILIRDFGRRSFAVSNGDVSIDNPTDRAILGEWNKKKELLKNRLRTFFQLRFNPDLELKGAVLDSLGFRACKRCHEKIPV